VTRPGLLLWGALALLGACAQTRSTIPPGYALTDSNTGVVIVRVEYVDGSGKPLPTMAGGGGLIGPNRIPMSWTREGGGQSFDLEPVNEGSASDFYVALPAGVYRMVHVSGVGFNERWYVIRFSVEPGVVTYAGMLRFKSGLLKGRQEFTPYDEYDAAVARFRASHSALGSDVRKSLLRLYIARGGYVEEQPWIGPAHENPPY
jgi:hypothetical protein